MLNKLRHSARLFITGGDWANALPSESRRNLYRYWFDGLFAAASDTVPINYLTLYLLAVGATGAQVGWFSALSSLAAALALLPGAFIVEKYGRRKEFTVIFGGLLARILLILMALAPFPVSGQPLIWLVITLGVIRSAAGNLAFPAWMSLTGDIVPSEMKLSLTEVWQDFRSSPLFFQFCITMAVWNLALNIAGPFFNVYMAQDLGFTAAMIGLATIAANVTRVLTQRKMGELADRWGAGRLQMVSMFLVPILPILWLFAGQLWHVLVINSFAGVFWGAFELASFNFLLVFMPENRRARYSAIFQVVVTVSLAGGAALGSALIDFSWGYDWIFILSSIGRFTAAFMFLALLRKARAG